MTADEWFASLPYSEAQKVMRRQATDQEVKRLHSRAAARTWWKLLDKIARDSVYELEQGQAT